MIIRVVLLMLGAVTLAQAAEPEQKIAAAEVKSITLVADTGKPFGEVTVIATRAAKEKDFVLGALSISVGGTKIECPDEALVDILRPDLGARVAVASDKDDSILLVSIVYAPKPGDVPADPRPIMNAPPAWSYGLVPRPVNRVATFAVRGGKLLYREDTVSGKIFNALIESKVEPKVERVWTAK